MKSPTVSIIIPCFNARKTVAAAVHSALSQTYSAIEVILVDDGSTDDTADVIRSLCLADARIRAIYLGENLGPSVARNAAISQAKGEWIVLLDADDLYEPHRVEALLNLALSTGADLVADNLIVEDDTSGRRKLGFSFCGAEPVSFSLSSFLALQAKNGGLDLGFLKPLMRRHFLDEHKLEFATKYRVGEDFLLFAECLHEGGRLVVLPQAGYIYRRGGNSITQSGTNNASVLASMAQELISRWQHQLSADDLRSLKARQRLFDEAVKYQRLRAAIDSGAFFRAAGVIFDSPSVMREVMRGFWRKICKS